MKLTRSRQVVTRKPIMQTKPTKNNNLWFIFDSQAEVTSYTKGELFHKRDKEFVGEELNTWKEVDDRTKKLWEHGIETLNMFTERLKGLEIPELKSCIRKTRYTSIPTDDIDMERMLAGDPNFYKITERESSSGPVEVTILIDTTTPADMDPEDILWRGAAAVAVAYIMEAKGYRTDIWVVNGSKLFQGMDKGVMVGVNVKRCSDPLDQSTLCNVVAGWFYRTLHFTLLATICKNCSKEVAYGFGACHTPNAIDLDEITTSANRIYASGVFTFNGAANLIEAEVKKLADEGN